MYVNHPHFRSRWVRDFAGIMARVRSGEEIVIESQAHPVAVIRAAEPLRLSISDCIQLARKHEEETGAAPVLDADFAADVEETIRDRKPSIPPSWD